MSEKTLHRAVCDYLRLQYPDVLFNSDLSGSMKLTIGQAKALKYLRSNRGWPDIFIAEPRGNFAGFFLELKREGKIVNSQHVKEQKEMIKKLNDRGYFAFIAAGFDEAKKVIDAYMGLPEGN